MLIWLKLFHISITTPNFKKQHLRFLAKPYFIRCHLNGLDSALFNVNVAVSNALPQNDSGKSVRDIIDRTIYLIENDYNVRAPHYTVVFQVAWVVKQFHIVLNERQTRNSNIHLHDEIIETLFSCYDDSPLHSEIPWTFQMFQTCVSLSKYTHIYWNHWWR